MKKNILFSIFVLLTIQLSAQQQIRWLNYDKSCTGILEQKPYWSIEGYYCVLDNDFYQICPKNKQSDECIDNKPILISVQGKVSFISAMSNKQCFHIRCNLTLPKSHLRQQYICTDCFSIFR